MQIKLRIKRFDPDKSEPVREDEFTTEAEPTDRVLSVLMSIKRTQDPTLAFRRSCAHGVCGSDAMVINGKERLACKTLVKDVLSEDGAPIRIEPLRTLPVQRDLMVDQTQFFENYIAVSPFLINQEPPPEKERPQSPAEQKKFDDATNCILCASCYSACPIVQQPERRFIGPAAVVQAARFLDDSRDQGFEARLPVLDAPDGVWPCESRFECTRVCPRGIKVTKHINLTKRRITKHKEEHTGSK